jgi:hypothetical protein
MDNNAFVDKQMRFYLSNEPVKTHNQNPSEENSMSPFMRTACLVNTRHRTIT